MLVTVFADASHDAHHRAGGWGCYLVSARGRHKGGGALRGFVANSSLAEAMAVVNAVHTAFAHGIALPGDRLLIQTDCLFARDTLSETEEAHLARIKNGTGKVAHWEALIEVRRRFLQIIAATRSSYEIRWVKGHQEGVTTRSYANEVCDQIAKEHMRRRRNTRKVAAKRRRKAAA